MQKNILPNHRLNMRLTTRLLYERFTEHIADQYAAPRFSDQCLR